MIIRSPNVRPGEIAIGDAKRLLQQYLQDSDINPAPLSSKNIIARSEIGCASRPVTVG
jgi:hypothetical protein